MIKATYTLDPDTVRVLEAMARRLGVSKSAALREAIHIADRAARAGRSERAGDADPRLAALDRLRKRLALTPAAADAWVREAAELRRDSDRVEQIWGEVRPTRRVAEAPPLRRK